MAGGRGNLGWVILAAALAVPGFLFYNWMSRLKTEREHAVSQNARKRAEGGVFETPPAAGRLINPISSTAAPSGLASPAPSARAFAPTVAVASAPVAAAPLVRPAAPQRPNPAVPSAVAPDVSSTTVIVLSRDPMMSPLDIVRLQEIALEEEERKRRLQEELDRKNRAAAPVVRHAAKKTLKPIETRIELQGIVAKPDGDNLAMINGATVNPGESFLVEGYPGKVSVLKISASEVTMQYQGRKFRMSVNTE